jgi:2',3'-cyclic-nucleotide 2'-phosphodiesterase
MLKILFFGDIVGSLGREAVAKTIPQWKKEHDPDLIIANGENIAHGKGVTLETLNEIFAAGVEVVTSGNHIWNFPEAQEILRDENIPLLRPANFSSKLPGKGQRIINVGTRRVLILNLMGQAAMHQHPDSPFEAADKILDDYTLPSQAQRKENEGKEIVHAIILDWHCELTSEKQAMGWHLDGRVSAVLGSHTHVPTADERILPKGTAYISDAGMVGARNSILGVEVEPNLRRFVTQLPSKLAVEERSPADVNAVLVSIDPATGRASDIKRLHQIVEIL